MRNGVHLEINTGIWLIFIYSVFILPSNDNWTREWGLVILISFLLVYLGSLTPDQDKYYPRIISNKLDQVYRKVIVKPIQKKYCSYGHREITHSLNGFLEILTRNLPIIIILSLLGVILQILWYYYGSLLYIFWYTLKGEKIITPLHNFDILSFYLRFLIIGIIGYSWGYLGHLWEDSSTILGVRLWFPKIHSQSPYNIFKDDKRITGEIRSDTINERLAIRYNLAPIIFFLYIGLLLDDLNSFLIIPISSITWGIVLLTGISFICLGWLFRNKEYASWLLVSKLCDQCGDKMQLVEDPPKWKCRTCEIKIPAQEEYGKRESISFFSREWPFPLFLGVELILIPGLLFIIIISTNFIFSLVITIISFFIIILEIWYYKHISD